MQIAAQIEHISGCTLSPSFAKVTKVRMKFLRMWLILTSSPYEEMNTDYLPDRLNWTWGMKEGIIEVHELGTAVEFIQIPRQGKRFSTVVTAE